MSLLLGCSTGRNMAEGNAQEGSSGFFRYLALGDSYTAGTSVPFAEGFPIQLKNALSREVGRAAILDRIAVAGWRTDDLLEGMEAETPSPDYDLVTLLIGVNNQYQGYPFTQYEAEFPKLLQQAIALAMDRPEHVVVVSIPDYAFTPFGQSLDPGISTDIDRYNAFAEREAQEKGALFVNITDISRNGLEDPSLVADDDLHLSGKAYAAFVDRILPKVLSKLKD